MNASRRQPAQWPTSERTVLDRGVRVFVRDVDVTGVGDMRTMRFEREVVRAFEATAKVLAVVSGSDAAYRESRTFRSEGPDLECLDEAARVVAADLAEFGDLVSARRMAIHVWMTVGERFFDVVRSGEREQFFEIPADWRVPGADGSASRLQVRFFNGVAWTTGAAAGRRGHLPDLVSSVLPAETAARAVEKLDVFLSRVGGIERDVAA